MNGSIKFLGKDRPRRKIGRMVERPLEGHSLPNLLKELAFLTYELKALRTVLEMEGGGGGNGGEMVETADGRNKAWMERKEGELGNRKLGRTGGVIFQQCEIEYVVGGGKSQLIRRLIHL